ncbi:MAG: hypothetical protein ABI947_20695 [Chloroflexota bacterium]
MIISASTSSGNPPTVLGAAASTFLIESTSYLSSGPDGVIVGPTQGVRVGNGWKSSSVKLGVRDSVGDGVEAVAVSPPIRAPPITSMATARRDRL